jgi:predicted DNA-binding protein (MmcQ/YjbR family)
MSWVSVLNPSAATFDKVKPLLSEAYDLAVGKFAKRVAGR